MPEPFQRTKTANSVLCKGNIFCEQLESIAQQFGIPLKMTGVQSMPYPWIEGDDDHYQNPVIVQNCRFLWALFSPPSQLVY